MSFAFPLKIVSFPHTYSDAEKQFQQYTYSFFCAVLLENKPTH
ncbi:hypothetical protein B598_0986 [Chlamydia psittaci GR9]|uniref:Uncharacterized protein n=1 Tax=Chlamydia psittaci 99DC5 TaxID=1112251 RepID=A0ABP2X3L3_CHLPS|nr:hypothetical protein B598_0986 [Chlamydia psittaci GR9]AFS24585.1 hypothetical protein B602_0990 [Chlamydia psittaci M56]AFS28484.1 hypothetical protein B712_0988 [Chlamydia psittaci NJ1]EPJ14305.1 hypothetical protein CP02DC16_0308 [Chlamydia psittaci 02DC16]EPJ17282.1 hypothetical protein CP02DC22_0313 [Chlamydia psittaci 02DC22]EPJ19258.1 hypothetical protein CP03DC29_1125 [Chlamydia psittaci 03DC29]EPJ28165.1 hypothetical protein CP99DC5_0316 [Chlamydia psittaci 99DC5]